MEGNRTAVPYCTFAHNHAHWKGTFFLRAQNTVQERKDPCAMDLIDVDIDLINSLMGMTQWVRDEYLHCDSDCHGYDAYFAALQQPHITFHYITLHAPVELALYWNVQTSAFMWDHDIHTLHADGLHDGLQTYLSETSTNCNGVVREHHQNPAIDIDTIILRWFPNYESLTWDQAKHYYKNILQRAVGGPILYWRITAPFGNYNLWQNFYPQHVRLTRYNKFSHYILECDASHLV